MPLRWSLIMAASPLVGKRSVVAHDSCRSNSSFDHICDTFEFELRGTAPN
jgi:hypothetical protein